MNKGDTPDSHIFHVAPFFTESDSFRGLRALSDAQKAGIKKFRIDLSAVQWADPQCLLQMLLVLKYAHFDGAQISVHLGSVSHPQEHAVFLAFLNSQGFLAVLNDVAYLHLGSRRLPLPEVQKRIDDVATMPRLGMHVCIPMEIIDATDFVDDPRKLQALVERMIDRADELSLKSAFGSQVAARDMLFQKMRRTLFELLQNVGEHAYGPGKPAFGAVFARLRLGKPRESEAAQDWLEMLNRSRALYGNRNFSPNYFSEWVELFICDVGKGLTADIHKWKAGNNDILNKAIQRASKLPNPLESIFSYLFVENISRIERHESGRTSVTGLQHLGKILAIGGDYARFYTHEGFWIGNVFPWQASTHSRRGIIDRSLGKGFARIGPPGTAYHISIQPRHEEQFLDEYPIQKPQKSTLNSIRDALKGRIAPTPEPPLRTIAVDRRIASTGYSAADAGMIEEQKPSVLVLRPARLMSKNDTGKWLALTHGTLRDRPLLNLNCFAIVELSNFNMTMLVDLLLSADIHRSSTAVIWLVSESWYSLRLKADNGRFRYLYDEELDEADGLISFADLAVLLREMDSELFWLDQDRVPRPALLNIRVNWKGGVDGAVVLNRYLDFAQSLTDPTAFRACRRAVRRLLALFPEREIRGADDLANSVLASINLPGLLSRDSGWASAGEMVVVGSIAVTGETTRDAHIGDRVELINILHHDDAEIGVFENSTAALLWVTEVTEKNGGAELSPIPDDDPVWERIPGTAFVSKNGSHALPILRYKRRDDGGLDFRNPYYARSPEETYEDLRRYKALQLGHWRYGARHDLLTVNLRSALSHAFIELGPLYAWLKETFAKLFARDPDGHSKAQLLVYPSHPVTDFLMDRIRQDRSGFPDEIQPLFGILPIKFSSERTVSPFVAFQPFQTRIEDSLQKFGMTAWSAAVFDDGVISGKHLREITQLLQSLNVSGAVQSVAVVDRTGLPSQEGLMDRHLRNNHRFWRWDVPTLGTARNCLLCHALAMARLHATLAPDRIRNRVAQWLIDWRERDSEREWYSGFSFRRLLDPSVKVAFGVSDEPDGRVARKYLEAHDAFELASTIVEIARLTGNFNLALRRAKELEGRAPEAALYLVATQFLLFNDELTPAKKLYHLGYLLQRLWLSAEANEATALAALCISSCDKSVASLIRDSLIARWLPTRDLGSIDAVIACQFVLNSAPLEQSEIKLNPSDALERNLLRLELKSGAKAAVKSFLIAVRSEAGKESPARHKSLLRLTLDALSSAKSDGSDIHALRVAPQLLEEAQAALGLLDKERVASVPAAQMQELERLTSAMLRSLSKPAWPDVVKLASAAHRILYGQGTKVKGLMPTISSELFLELKDSQDCYNNLVKPLQEQIFQTWNTYVEDRLRTEKNNRIARIRWTQRDGDAWLRPVWVELAEFEGCFPCIVYFDKFVEVCVRDVMLNVFHSKRMVDANEIVSDHNYSRRGDQWWQAVKMEGYLVLEFFNISTSDAAPLKDNAAVAGLERVGGSIEMISTPVGDQEFLMTVRVKLPTLSSFLGS